MRNVSCNLWVELFKKRPFVFMTGDLGYNALEPLREAMGERFINAGIAEQNMVSAAAGMVMEGLDVWVYSIAPFCYARPFEQIRNGLCIHDLPVKLVGNGGGYAYGPMGATHHAIEDYGALLTLQNMRVFVPAFSDDLAPIITAMADIKHPSYLRLGRCEKPAGFTLPKYGQFRRLCEGGGAVVLCVGPVAGGVLAHCMGLPQHSRPELWCVSELPIDKLPDEFAASLRRKRSLVVAEEHVAQGGVGQMVSRAILIEGIALDSFSHVHALGYPSRKYGTQGFHRRECGLDVEGIMNQAERMNDGRQ